MPPVVASMVSNHADTEAYVYLLSAFNRAALELAQEIVYHGTSLAVDGVSQDDIESACRAVIDEKGLIPAFFMIDGCDAERAAIETVFMTIPMRARQFCVMQAVKSVARRLFGRHPDRDTLVTKLLQAFRRCQRCPTEAEWPAHYARFQHEVEELTHNVRDRASCRKAFFDYLRREWFSSRWRRFVVDFGIPPHVTRDGPWSTNNYSESAFRTFDHVFLRCQANRRCASLSNR